MKHSVLLFKLVKFESYQLWQVIATQDFVSFLVLFLKGVIFIYVDCKKLVWCASVRSQLFCCASIYKGILA